MYSSRTLVMNSNQVNQRLNRLAWQVYEQCSDETEIVVAGIASNGYRLAEKIRTIVQSISGIRIDLIEMKINKENPLENPSISVSDPELFSEKKIIIVDDVSNSGRTLMYGVKYFLAFPVKSIHTLVLVDRDHNRYPVKTNFVGLSLATTLQEHISVEMNDDEGISVYLD